MKFKIFLLALCLKLLLIPSYYSTDFEVHRNWLAITHSLPLQKWYYDNTSESTLDYPPFFAYFEYILSQFAKFVDPKMLEVTNLNYASYKTIVFQRLTVCFASDLIFYIALYKFLTLFFKEEDEKFSKFLSICYVTPSLIIVDNIHFQYNAILFGILVMSIYFMQQKRYIMGGIMFAVLLNMKHIFIYMIPAYFLYLLICYCCENGFSIWRFTKLGLSVISIFGISFIPFLVGNPVQHLKQILSRLFPFERGLTHAYWAPNFWAVYNVLDKIALYFIKFTNPEKYKQVFKVASLTGGLVGLNQGGHAILPTIKPIYTIILSLSSSFLICLALILMKKKRDVLLECIIHSTFCFFMFGWHVHEKAIIMVLVPLSLLQITKSKFREKQIWAKWFMFLSIIGTYSLFPLLFRPQETPIKWLLLLSYIAWSFIVYEEWRIYKTFSKGEIYYLLLIIPLEIFCVTNIAQIHTRLPFLNLMMISVYCSVGIIYTFIGMLRSSFTE